MADLYVDGEIVSWLTKSESDYDSNKPNKMKVKEKEKVIHSQWAQRGENTFIPTDNNPKLDKLKAGVYDLRFSDGTGFYMVKREIHLDELLEFPNAVHKTVLGNIKDFWNRKEKFREYGFAFKRGILIYGPPGSGKSCTINLATKYMVDELDAVVLPLSTSGDLSLYLNYIPEVFRMIEPNRPLFVIFEDLETLCQYKETESALLNVLDGIEQLENVVYIGTTNYIEQLKARIINRPSRFDRRIYVGMPNEEDREFYFTNKLKIHDLEAIDIKLWVKETEGFSIAHLAELIKSVVILGNTFEEAIEILKELNKTKGLHSDNYENDGKSIGFSGNFLTVGATYNEISKKSNLSYD